METTLNIKVDEEELAPLRELVERAERVADLLGQRVDGEYPTCPATMHTALCEHGCAIGQTCQLLEGELTSASREHKAANPLPDGERRFGMTITIDADSPEAVEKALIAAAEWVRKGSLDESGMPTTSLYGKTERPEIAGGSMQGIVDNPEDQRLGRKQDRYASDICFVTRHLGADGRTWENPDG